MTIREALAVITRVSPTLPPETAEALAVVVDFVHEHLPKRPRAVKGRTVHHAVSLRHDRDRDLYTEIALCGGLQEAEHLHSTALDALPYFDADADSACKTCIRRLPAPFRPAKVDRATPVRQRLKDAELHSVDEMVRALHVDCLAPIAQAKVLLYSQVREALRAHACG